MKRTKLRIVKDAADALLGFPWSAPAKPSARSTTSNGFVETAAITDANLKEMFRRNQAAHTIIDDVAKDAVPDIEFRSPEDKELEAWNAEARTIFEKFILQPTIRAIFFTRLYGYCGILIGYADGKDMAEPVSGTPQIQYLQAIPKPWVSNISAKKDEDGNLTLPKELDYYELNISNKTKKIDASRMVHIQNQSADEESMTGESSLICLFDILTSLKSMDWGAGQAMWRHGGGMTVFIAPDSADPQTQIDAIDEVTADINAMTVLTMPPGTEVITGATGALNPSNYYTVAMEQISVGSRIPVSILRGSVAGALSASEKDRKDYQELLHEIQKTQITPAVRELLQKFQASGQLSEQEFIINWKIAPTLILEEKRGKLLDAQAELTKTKALEIAEGMANQDPLNLKEE
jgi:hypothetical protein